MGVSSESTIVSESSEFISTVGDWEIGRGRGRVSAWNDVDLVFCGVYWTGCGLGIWRLT